MLQFDDTDSVAIVSGGLDSTTLVYDMIEKGYRPHLLSFNYGQRHSKELTFAQWHARQLGLPHDVVDLRGLTYLISNSALTSGKQPHHPGHKYDERGNRLPPFDSVIEVPEGHYAEDTMKLTVVPNRNMIMLAIAAGVAVNEHARVIGIGVHAGDHFVYPDCRPAFINAMDSAIVLGNEGFHNLQVGLPKSNGPKQWNEDSSKYTVFDLPQADMPDGPLYAPFLFKSKEDIAYRAFTLDVPVHMTWSCYKGGDLHCGRCGTCVERLEAIAGAHQRLAENDIPFVSDPTEYEDNEYWKTVTAANAD